MNTTKNALATLFFLTAMSGAAFAAADISSTPMFKVNGSNAQFDFIFVNRGPDVAKSPKFGAKLLPGLTNVTCTVGHNQASQPLPAGSASASYSPANGVITLSNLASSTTTPDSLKDDEAFVVRCMTSCVQNAFPAAWSDMGAANAGKNEDGVDRSNSASIKIKVDLCK